MRDYKWEHLKKGEADMRNALIVVDMQNDFINGALGTKEAVEILPNVKKKLENFEGDVFFTRDTHEKDYLNTQEGTRLPVMHCIRNSHGWQISEELPLRAGEVIDKPTFGSVTLAERLAARHREAPYERITLIGLCTDICVISNAMLIKAYLSEVTVAVDASCCAGVTPESHRNALAAMQMCQIEIEE